MPRLNARQRFTFRITLALVLTVALLLIPSTPFLIQGTAGSLQSQSSPRLGRPKPGKPEGVLPDLDTVRNETPVAREPVMPIPSTMRSTKSPFKPWDGKRVGDPLTTIGQVNNGPGRRNENYSANNKVSERSIRESQNNGGIAHRAHTAGRLRTSSPPSLLDDSFIDNFYNYALPGYTPLAAEKPYWRDQFRVGLAHGQGSVKLAAIEMGKTLFESAAYAARQRDNHWYVYDLYETYLMRYPDSGGWAYWEAALNSQPPSSRENVRRGFEDSTEFANLTATIVANGSPSSNPVSLITSRVEPRNQPGNGMLARDATWSAPLLSLPGRAGLDLGLTLSYSSHVWTPSGPFIYFDEDNGFPSPGFRLGFPTVQRKTFDAQTNTNTYLLLTPAGHRVELRQVGTSNIYEAGDSSHLQLTDNGNSWLVRSTDGTQLTFAEQNNEYHCTQIKDRNGNYLTVNYDGLGHITTITDTLGRTITFNYDGNANLLTITQSWNGPTTHQWVSFGWTTRTMQASFSGSAVVGTANGTLIPVISQVNLTADGSTFLFDYTNPLQVSAITRKSFDNVQRSQIAFTYDSPTNDVARITYSNVSALNWTGVNGVPAQVPTHYEVAGDGACVMTVPDGTVYKEYYGTGWQKGLITRSEVWTGAGEQKWTTTAWTQDNTSVSYETNPRITETNVYDGSNNRRRTVIEYGSYAQWGLPYGVHEYANDGQTELRQTWTDYNLSQSYLDRRIIGLVSAVHMSNVASWQSKVTYSYDNPSQLQSLPAVATQHDSAYSALFTTRGNVTAVSRWDVTDVGNANKALTTQINYNEAGSIVSTSDPMGHTNSVVYADSFSDNNNRNTFAYPTTVTDADNFSSTAQYNFDFGATTRTQGPPPAGQSQGVIQTMSYLSSTGQLERVTTTNNGAYKRFWYGPDYVASYATVNSVADEAYSIEVFDGVGQVFGAAGNHPGSSGGYRLAVTIYDQMGRAVQQSNPTEVNNSWVPTGDDAAGMYNTTQTYDWKGRPLRTTHPDTTYSELSYAGCGCAGGEVVTLTDEVNRQQKIYSDVFGRAWKNVAMSWPDGNQNRSEYATTVKVYNVRDQVTNIKAYAGSAPADASSTNAAASCPNPSTTCQETLLNYDGYGRLQAKHVPEQIVGTTIQYSTYSYNTDDTLNSSTDARGAVTTYSYNGRHLVTGMTSSLTGLSTINVTYGYDAAGNRTSMLHTVGGAAKDGVTFAYNPLSRLTSETRHINALDNYGPNYGYFTIGYGYTLSGALQSLTDAFNSPTNFSYDSIGRTTSVTGSYGGPNYTYASSIGYRAWGAARAATFNNVTNETVSYNARMQPTQFRLTGSGYNYMRLDYTYYNDGRLQQLMDLDDQMQTHPFHYMARAYSYDQAKRTATVTPAPNHGSIAAPFTGTYAYDAFDNMTSRNTQYGVGLVNPTTDSATYSNNRRNGWTYDVDGRVTTSTDITNPSGSSTCTWTYDASGRLTTTNDGTTSNLAYDGDGQLLSESVSGGSDYLLRSTVLQTILTKLDANGNKNTTYVPTNNLVMVLQQKDWQGNPTMLWINRDVLGLQENGSAYDPFGNLIQNVDPPSSQQIVPWYGPAYGTALWASMNANNLAFGCIVDGIRTNCNNIHPSNDNGMRTGSDFLGNRLNGGIVRTVYGDGSRLISASQTGDHSWQVTVAPDPSGDSFVIDPFENELAGSVIVRQLLPQNPEPNVDDLQSRIAKMVSNPDCAKFISNLINGTATTKNPAEFTDALKGFEKIKGQGGFIYGDTIEKYYGFRGGTVHGTVSGGNAQVELPFPIPFRSFGPVNQRAAAGYAEAQAGINAMTALHEILHLAGKNQFSDDDYANTVAAMRGVTPPTFANVRRASEYWTGALEAACKPR